MSNITSGDSQQFEQDKRFNVAENGGTIPTVRLLHMTSDPLGAIAALASMYEGRVIRSLADLTDEDRRRAFENTQKTHLRAPLESVKLHFLIEGVDRAFTHQLVRQRTAVYAQESLRFAVVEDLAEASTLPPSLEGTKPSSQFTPADMENRTQAQRWRNQWDDVIDHIDVAYRQLVDDGMPAEEARGLLPHCTATRIQYVTDLRNLAEHAGNRTCSQAQHHWRIVFLGIVEAIRNGWQVQKPSPLGEWIGRDRWQFEMIADSGLFRPICYQLNKCPFRASFDRACSIRDRVVDYSERGVTSDQWDPSMIQEVMVNPGAARA